MGTRLKAGKGVYFMILNYYELLNIRYDADISDIKTAYQDKILKTDDTMREQLNTAYMTLSNDKLRQKYDLSIGIHKYKNVSPLYKAGKGFLRVMLTLIDAFMTWYWCFLFVLLCAATGYLYYKYKTTGEVNISYYYDKYFLIIIVLGFIALIDLISHYYIRRLNRKLKHYKWEIIRNSFQDRRE